MEIYELEENLNNELKNDFRAMKDGFVQVGERKWFVPKKYVEVGEELKNFEVRPDDIWIMGYPRSGTTLTQELIWQLTHDLDCDSWKTTELDEKARFFENNLVLNEKTASELEKKFPEEGERFQDIRDTLKKLNSYKTRRVLKTHLPFELLPQDIFKKGCKIIYICRFPKDVCVSYFHLQSTNRITDFGGDFQKYWRYFRNGHSMFGPYFEHVKQGFEKVGTKNYWFIFFEDFAKDNRTHIQKVAEFLEIPLTDDDLKKLEEFISIDNFRNSRVRLVKDKNNEPVNFVRKGKVGGWKEHFTQEMNIEADAWIAENTKRIGIKYPQKDK